MPTVDNLTLEDRRRVLEYADRVSALAEDAPDAAARKLVYVAANGIRKEYGFSREAKKAVILTRVLDGAATVPDLIRESGFHQADVYELARELAAEGMIREMRMRNGANPGRMSVCFYPKDE